MNRAVPTLGLLVSLAAPGAAQWLGEPVWNSPQGGGLSIGGDYAKPNSNYGKGNTWGVRASLGLGATTLTAGVVSWAPEGHGSLTSVGGNAAFRLSGDSLPPIAVILQVGAAHTDEANSLISFRSETVLTGALGFSVPLRAPRFSVEPYVSPGVRHRSVSGGRSSTDFGYAIGANVGFGSFGVHVAYDNEKVKGGGNVGVLGVGAHVQP
jgi:hypothetical protein